MPTIGLLMIVNNGAETISRCLASVHGLVDTMVIGDTGSTDGTPALAAAMGAKVLHVPWENDFARARNTVLAALDTDWVLTLDADEEVMPEAHAWIRRAVEAPGPAAYLVPVRNYLSPGPAPPPDQVMLKADEGHPRAPDAVAYFPSSCCRLFRRLPGVVYTGCVHEMVDYNLPPLGHGVEPAGFVIHHFGWYLADAARTARKRTLYRELLGEKLAAMPMDTNTLVRYAVLLAEDCGRLEEALGFAERAAEIDGAAPGAWLFTGMILRRMGRYAESLQALERVPATDQPAFRTQLEADALYGLGRLDEARARYGEAYRMAPLDRLIAAKLGLLEVRTGAVSVGLARLADAVEAAPLLLDAEEMQVCALLSLERETEAAEQARRLAARHGSAEAWVQMARIFARTNCWPLALTLVEQALEQLPGAEDLHQFRIRAAVATGRLDRAIASAEQVIALCPSPAAYLRLATLLVHDGREPEASSVLVRGLRLFPDSRLLTGEATIAGAAGEAAVYAGC